MSGRVCNTCGGTGEVGPDHVSRSEYAQRVRVCPDCDGSGSPDRPPPTWMDGDYQRDARDGF